MPAALPLSAMFAAFDRLLGTQPGARAQLLRHAGKVVHIGLPLLELRLLITPEGGVAAAEAGTEPAAEIAIPPDVLFALVLGEQGALARARVRGDGLVANDLSAALRVFDWALALRPVTGDIVAARAAQAIAGLGRWREQAHESAGRALVEYLTYETDVLADAIAVRGFITEVDTLRDAVARLEARIALAERRRG